MSDAARDLSGHWHGIYTYPDGIASNSFEADLRDVGGVLTGETREASDSFGDIHPEQTAFLDGSRTGSRVRFVKRYDEMHRELVHYDGDVDADGTEIAGRWTIPGEWSGTFVMIRPRADAVEQVEAVAAPVP